MSIRKLPNELQEKAIAEMNEVPARIPSDLNAIKEWLAKQPQLNARKDDQSLLNFLRNAKFSLERAKQKIDLFYTVRSMAPEYFDGRDPFLPEIEEILKRGMLSLITDDLNPSSPMLLMIRWKEADPAKVSIVVLLKVILMMLDVCLNESDAPVINGVLLLQDFDGISFAHVGELNPALTKKYILALQDSYPIKLNGIYCTNAPAFAETVFHIARPIFKEKLRKKFCVCSGSRLDMVQQMIPRSLLPEEYGGNAGPLSKHTAEWKEKLEKYRDWFVEDARYRSDEKLRPGKPVTAAELFGVDGSFRKLEFD